MKKVNTIMPLILLILAGCGGNRLVDETEGYLTIDVTKSYPKKELILQNFMDVEYIPLETTDEFITQGVVMDIGKENIVVRNRLQDGDIFIFDRSGKGLRKINRRGQGAEEYLVYLSGGSFLDEDKNEIYINNGIRFSFIVYDLYGNFKRTVRYKEGPFIINAFNYDKDNILAMEEFWPEYDEVSNRNSFFLIYKQDGGTKEIEIPFKKKISVLSTREDAEGNTIDGVGPRNSLITPFQNNWILMEPSSDTIYQTLPDYSLTPFIVRTPSVQSMDPEIFLFPGVLTDRYYFMQTVKKEVDWDTHTMPTTDLMYDRQEKKIYQYTVTNADFSNRTEDLSVRAANSDAFYFILEAPDLVEAYEKGQLKGRLKEIAATLDTEDNPVIMIAKHKK